MAPQRGCTTPILGVFRHFGHETLYMDFGDNIISIEGVITSQIIRHIVKI